MQSTMQDFPLTVGMIFRHGRSVHRDSEVVTFEGEKSRRASFAEVAERADRLAAALRHLEVDVGDRVGTFAWNTQEHLEAYFAIPGIGAVLHTLNLRLFPEQLVYIVNHAEDKVVVIDDSLVAAARAPCAAAGNGRALHRGGRGRRVGAGGSRRGGAPVRRAAGGGTTGLPVSRSRRARRRGDVLHERHDRQPQGGRLLAPIHVPALDRCRSRQCRPLHRPRPGPPGRPDVPRQCLGHPVRGVARGRRPPHARPLPPVRAAGEVHRGGAPHVRGGGAHDLDRPPALRRREPGRPVVNP